MATTYLQLVNDVLVRLRESTVSSVSENEYSSLIGKLVNDAKREVEDAWDWDELKTTITVSTVASTYNYALTGAGSRFRIEEVINDTNDWFVVSRPSSFMTENLLLNPQPTAGSPQYYAINGADSNGDIKVDLFPIPDAVYSIKFDGYAPSAELSNDTDTILVPKNPVIALAWAKAIEERGEDGGINVSSQYAVAKQSLADHIAIQAGRRPTDTIWYPV